MVIKLSIPANTHLLVETGQKITLGDPLVEETTTEDFTLSISSQLKIKPQDIFQFCTVLVGNTVAPGDILAQKKHFLGNKKITCETVGTVKHIDHTSGVMTLSKPSDNTAQIRSCVTGEIRDVNLDEGTLSVEIGPADSYSAKGNQDCGGKWVYLTDKDVFSCDEDDIKNGCIGMHTSHKHITSKMEALGALCIVSVDGPESDIPCVRIDESVESTISQTSRTHVVYSLHDMKLYAYSPVL